MPSLISVDLRIIYDNEEQKCIVGCHVCTKTRGADINRIPEIVSMISEFATVHLQSCGKTSE